jgi:proteic killer suppression protein
VIQSFADQETRRLFETGKSRRWVSVARVAVRKLAQIDAAVILDELNAPPGNRLEALRGSRAGQYSIRI